MKTLKLDIREFKLIESLISYEFKTIFEYFNYIDESYLNGQKKQVIELYNELTPNFKIMYIDICSEDIKTILLKDSVIVLNCPTIVNEPSKKVVKLYKQLYNNLKN